MHTAMALDTKFPFGDSEYGFPPCVAYQDTAFQAVSAVMPFSHNELLVLGGLKVNSSCMTKHVSHSLTKAALPGTDRLNAGDCATRSPHLAGWVEGACCGSCWKLLGLLHVVARAFTG